MVKRIRTGKSSRRYSKKRYSKKRYSKKRYSKKRYSKKRYSRSRYSKKRKSIRKKGGSGADGSVRFKFLITTNDSECSKACQPPRPVSFNHRPSLEELKDRISQELFYFHGMEKKIYNTESIKVYYYDEEWGEDLELETDDGLGSVLSGVKPTNGQILLRLKVRGCKEQPASSGQPAAPASSGQSAAPPASSVQHALPNFIGCTRMQDIKEFASDKEFYVYDAGGGGNCWFHVMAALLYGDSRRHMDVRTGMVNWVRNNMNHIIIKKFPAYSREAIERSGLTVRAPITQEGKFVENVPAKFITDNTCEYNDPDTGRPITVDLNVPNEDVREASGHGTPAWTTLAFGADQNSLPYKWWEEVKRHNGDGSPNEEQIRNILKAYCDGGQAHIPEFGPVLVGGMSRNSVFAEGAFEYWAMAKYIERITAIQIQFNNYLMRGEAECERVLGRHPSDWKGGQELNILNLDQFHFRAMIPKDQTGRYPIIKQVGTASGAAGAAGALEPSVLPATGAFTIGSARDGDDADPDSKKSWFAKAGQKVAGFFAAPAEQAVAEQAVPEQAVPEQPAAQVVEVSISSPNYEFQCNRYDIISKLNWSDNYTQATEGHKCLFKSPGQPRPSFTFKGTINQFHEIFGQKSKFCYSQLEARHDYIQWLFPSSTKSRFNSSAPPLTPAEINSIKGNPLAQQNIIRSLRMIADFYGFNILKADHLRPEFSRKHNFGAHFRNLNTPDNHNFMRISRIFQCLSETGLNKYIRPFLTALRDEIFTHKTVSAAADSYFKFWGVAAGAWSRGNGKKASLAFEHGQSAKEVLLWLERIGDAAATAEVMAGIAAGRAGMVAGNGGMGPAEQRQWVSQLRKRVEEAAQPGATPSPDQDEIKDNERRLVEKKLTREEFVKIGADLNEINKEISELEGVIQMLKGEPQQQASALPDQAPSFQELNVPGAWPEGALGFPTWKKLKGKQIQRWTERDNVSYGCGAMEGKRYWIGEGIITKYPNGCQDRCFANYSNGKVFLGIFDGSGGENAEKVSTIAATMVMNYLISPYIDLSTPKGIEQSVNNTFITADSEILDEKYNEKYNPTYEDSAGSTGIVAIVDFPKKKVTFSHVGDSRAIIYRPQPDGTLSYIHTNDHKSNVKALGHRIRKGTKTTTAVPEHRHHDINIGDVIVLVSDGILNAYAGEENNGITAMEKIRYLIQTGGRDENGKQLQGSWSEIIIDHAEKAYGDRYTDPNMMKKFARDDMSVSIAII